MIDTLKNLRHKFDLKFGDKQFSPITELSLGLVFKYIEGFSRQNEGSPFYLCFPEKKFASLWMSIAVLKNFFLEDYIYQAENRFIKLGIKNGEPIEIFGSSAIFLGIKAVEFKGIPKEEVTLKFSDGTIKISGRWLPFINKGNMHQVNNIKHYKQNRAALFNQRNAISKIIEPNPKVIINSEILTSKVLLITGRGNLGDFRNLLKSEFIYGEQLSKVFKENVNLIIKSDLEDYKSLFNLNRAQKHEDFKNVFNSLVVRLNGSKVLNSREFKELNQLFINDKIFTYEFADLLDESRPETNLSETTITGMPKFKKPEITT